MSTDVDETPPGVPLRHPVSAPAAATAGVLAAAASLATGELLSGIFRNTPSLVIGVGDLFVAETPGGIVRWSIENIGKSQKTLLVTGIAVAALVLGAAMGLLARTSLRRGAAGFAAFALVGGWAAARAPMSSDGWSWVSAVLSGLAGVGALGALVRLARRSGASRPGVAARPAAAAGVGRRGFLLASGGAVAWAAFGTGLGRWLRERREVEAARERLAARLGGPGPAPIAPGLEVLDDAVPGISPLVTPNRDFYRIDTAFFVPQVDPEGWTLRVTGMVDHPLELTLDDLLEMRRIDEFVTLQCVSNEVGGDLVGNARWSGVPLADLLALAGVQDGATQLVGRSVDGWTGGFPTELAMDGRPSMVAITMNGVPLPVKHGFPARLIIPGLYGYVSATKWLAEIELTTWEAFDGYWVPRGWAKKGPIKTQSRIDVPREHSTIDRGRTAIAGVAWAPTRAVGKVEVRVDSGPWREARRAEALSKNTWVQWVLEWDADPGEHRIQVRATDGTGRTQTAELADPAPSGATGYHAIRVTVR